MLQFEEELMSMECGCLPHTKLGFKLSSILYFEHTYIVTSFVAK